MDKRYVLDTSAIFTYIQAESGVKKIENILNLAKKGKCKIFISFITLMEIYYIVWQEEGEDVAKELIVLVKSLPIQIVESNEQLILSAGYIKANHRLSLADAIIAATAKDKTAILIHKDPEFESVTSLVKTLKLTLRVKKK